MRLIDAEEAKLLLFQIGKEKAARALDKVPTTSCAECVSWHTSSCPMVRCDADFGCMLFKRRQP